MNFHSDEWIMDRVKEHYEEALLYFPKDRIVGIFYQGSGNYGCDYENSDVDTKLIVVPSFEDIAMNKPPISTTHIRENDEHIDFKDIRLYMQTFRKQNLNFIEILFTKYKIINPIYKEFWGTLEMNREAIGRYNEYRGLKSMKGQANEKFHALEHHYPSRMEWIDKFGYDPKQLSHLFRIEEFIEKYINGCSYEECLMTDFPNLLIQIKTGTFPRAHDIEYVREWAKEMNDAIYDMIEKFEEKHPDARNACDEEVDFMLDTVQYKIMRKATKIELAKGE